MRAAPRFLRASAAAASAVEGAALARPSQPRPQVAQFPGKRSGLRLSVEEALYLAKEAGIWTTEEVQLQIARAPPFSPKERPFLIENFFEVPDTGERGADRERGPQEEEGGLQEEEDTDVADPVIHGAIRKYFRPDQPATFWHNGEEWLSHAEGRGTRKRASAHAVFTRGSGVFKVNGESDMFAWWPLIYHRIDVCQPFKLTGTAGAFDVFVQVKGGGMGGQAGAVRLAVARALLMANPTCHDSLQRGFCLLEDTRQKMSKMPGKEKARSAFPWSKR